MMSVVAVAVVVVAAVAAAAAVVAHQYSMDYYSQLTKEQEQLRSCRLDPSLIES